MAYTKTMSQNYVDRTSLGTSHKKAFTLIELLVVISIIGLLSSVVLASLNSARERARIAAAKSYASAQYRAFGADAVLSLNFDETSGNAIDEVNGLQCVLNGSQPRNQDTPFGVGRSAQLSGAAGTFCTITTTNSTNRSVTDVMNKNKSYTTALWFKPLVQKTNAVYLFPRSTNWSGLIFNANGRPTAAVHHGNNAQTYAHATKSLTIGAWHHLAMSVDTTSGKLALYVDGQLAASNNITSEVFEYLSTHGYTVGGIYYTLNNTDYSPNGLIDDVRVYAQAFTLAEVQKLYAEGLETRKLAQASNE